MLNIGQFLDEEPEEGDRTPWLLVYTSTLQCMGEAAEGRTWCPMGMCFTPQVSPLVDAFIEEMGVELTELGIAACWGQLVAEVPLQKQDGSFANVIAFLDGLVHHVPSQKVWDELVFPAPLAEPCILHRSTHLGYILAYDLASNGVEWVTVWGTVNDLSLTEDASAQELSNNTLLDSSEDIPQMDPFGEHHPEPTPVPSAVALHAGAAHCTKVEVVEQEPLQEERECNEYAEEEDSPVSSLWNSTDSDRHTKEADSPESSPQNSAGSDRQMEEEDEGELADQPTGKSTDGLMDETAVKIIEGHQPDDELTEDHPPGN